ncbi:MAG: T9SS type A sorting domain-containing protein [Rhodothermales bacterium]|nr:T9SS type A sorting domain-containing protein [Rhodothermales bacterium]
MRSFVLALFIANLFATSELLGQCTANSNSIAVTLDEADPGTFAYQWSVTNFDGGVGNRLEEVYFQIDLAAYSGDSVTLPTWVTASTIVDTWTALGFTFTGGTNIFNGATQTYYYELNQFVSNVLIRTIQRNGQVEDFTDFQNLGSGCPLPVELTSFTASVDEAVATLSWETASELNTLGFEVQLDRGQDFSAVGFVQAIGGTDRTQRYLFTHQMDPKRKALFRLRMIDLDGSFTYSPVVEIDAQLPSGFYVSDAFPNPFTDTASFDIIVDQPQTVRVVAYDILGREVATLHHGLVKPDQPQTIEFQSGNLPDGLYLVSALGKNFRSTQLVTMAN